MNFLTIKRLVSQDIWLIHLHEYSKTQRILCKILQVLILSARQFKNKNCSLQASSLTLITLFSIVPLFALAFGIAENFRLETALEEYVEHNFKDHKEFLNKVLQYAKTLLDSTKGGVVAGVGLTILIFTAMRMLHYIETAFNSIWEIKVGRSISRILTDYLSIMVITPVLIIFSSDIFIIFAEYIINFISSITIVDAIPFHFSIAGGVRYLLFCLVLTLINIIMPNTSVSIKWATVAGIIMGIVYMFMQYVYIDVQSTVSNYNKIYGSFAIFPLFLLWVQISWYIVLYCTTLVYSLQNVEKYRSYCLKLSLDENQQTTLALCIVSFVVKRFDRDDEYSSFKEISNHLHLPEKTIEDIINKLTHSKILALVSSKKKKTLVLPGLNIDKISIEHVLKALEAKKILNTVDFETPLSQTFLLFLKKAEGLRSDFLKNKLLKDL